MCVWDGGIEANSYFFTFHKHESCAKDRKTHFPQMELSIPSISLPIYLSIHLSFIPSIHVRCCLQGDFENGRPLFHMDINPFIHSFIPLSIYPSIHLCNMAPKWLARLPHSSFAAICSTNSCYLRGTLGGSECWVLSAEGEHVGCTYGRNVSAIPPAALLTHMHWRQHVLVK